MSHRTARRALVVALALASACKPAAQKQQDAHVADVVASAKPAALPPAPPITANVPEAWPYDLKKAPVTSKEGIVATDSAIATKVGVDILKKGGSALDAAIAVAFALAVVYPQAGNLGGGGFMLARKDGGVMASDFRETAPDAATRDMFVKIKPTNPDASLVGHLAAGVPGSVAGLESAYRHMQKGFAKLPWKELVEPARKLAEEGFVVDEGLAEEVRDRQKDLARFPASAALFLPGGKPIAAGSVMKNPDLARVLERIAERGAAGFYEGETAKLIEDEMRRGGGLITREDLRRQSLSVTYRTPVKIDYRGHTVYAMPPPSSGGLVLAYCLGVLSGYDLRSLGFNSAEALHLVAEAERRAFALRNNYLGDPAFVQVPEDIFLSPAAHEAARASIQRDHATPSSEVTPGKGGANEKKHTTHFSIVDREGAVVAMTTTINTSLGSAVVVDHAGFLLNNEMDDFATEPGKPNVFGLVQGEANAIAPGKRMLSSMTPTIVMTADPTHGYRAKIVTGASGGPTIISAALQITMNVIDHGMNAASAVSAPRIHHQHLPDKLFYEKGGLPEPVIQTLRAMGHTLEPRVHIADAPSLVRLPDESWTGSAEPRNKSGLALGL